MHPRKAERLIQGAAKNRARAQIQAVAADEPPLFRRKMQPHEYMPQMRELIALAADGKVPLTEEMAPIIARVLEEHLRKAMK